MPINKDISSLNPTTAIKVRKMLDECKKQGIEVTVLETTRSEMTQILYYLQGRLDVKNNKAIVTEYNRLRKKYGLWESSMMEALFKPVTWTFESNHFAGKAVDICPVKDGKPWWEAPEAVWQKLGNIAKECGLSWGGDWDEGKKDKPHFEDV